MYDDNDRDEDRDDAEGAEGADNEIEAEDNTRAVITVSGIPKDTDPIKLLQVLDTISENVYERMEAVEIGLVVNAPNHTVSTALDEDTIRTMRSYTLESGINFNLHLKACAAGEAILASTMMLEDLAANADWDSKPEAEKELIRKHYRQRSQHYEQEAVKELQDKRTHEIRQAFDIANAWAAEPDLSPMERCHGVAHELYQVYGADKKTFDLGDGSQYVPPSMQSAYQLTAGQAYAQHYDTQFGDQIKARTLRAAKELFGA